MMKGVHGPNMAENICTKWLYKAKTMNNFMLHGVATMETVFRGHSTTVDYEALISYILYMPEASPIVAGIEKLCWCFGL